MTGNPNGDATIVEFFDYNCFCCRKVRPVLEEAIATDKGLRLVYKDFPILGPDSEYAARAAIAAQAQGKYESFHHALISDSDKLDVTLTMEIAHKVGLDLERLKQDIESEAVKSVIQRNRALAANLRITRTPTFVIGDEFIEGFVELPTLQKRIRLGRQKPEGKPIQIHR